jgi:hypothetical protein
MKDTRIEARETPGIKINVPEFPRTSDRVDRRCIGLSTRDPAKDLVDHADLSTRNPPDPTLQKIPLQLQHLRAAQDHEGWIIAIKRFLQGRIEDLSEEER